MHPAILSALSLSKNEESVLKALIEFKYGKNVSVIARKAGLPRTTTLYILRRFEARKLAKSFISLDGRKGREGKRIHWMYDKRKDNLGIVYSRG